MQLVKPLTPFFFNFGEGRPGRSQIPRYEVNQPKQLVANLRANNSLSVVTKDSSSKQTNKSEKRVGNRSKTSQQTKNQTAPFPSAVSVAIAKFVRCQQARLPSGMELIMRLIRPRTARGERWAKKRPQHDFVRLARWVAFFSNADFSNGKLMPMQRRPSAAMLL